MTERRRGLIGTLLAMLAATLALGATPARTQPSDAAASARQILVMLRIPPRHYRPNGAYGGGYGDDLYRNARQRSAERIAHAHHLTLTGNWPMPLLGVDCYIMTVPEGRSPTVAAAEVARDGDVEWAEPLREYHALGAAAHDPLFAAQPAARQWQLADLHRMATGRGVTVAVIDSRIDATHPDLAGQVTASEDFVGGGDAGPERHGTAVAGVIAAIAGNGRGIAGIAPQAKLMALRACRQKSPASTVCDTLSLAKALHFAILHRADVINMSLSGPPDELLAKLLQVGMARGAVVVAAFDRALPDGGFPASEPGVIAVADESLPASVAGVYTAPGRDIPTTEPGARWYLVNGSSYAAAHVSGLIALIREHRARGHSIAFASARAAGGAIDACATLERVAGSCGCCASGKPLALRR